MITTKEAGEVKMFGTVRTMTLSIQDTIEQGDPANDTYAGMVPNPPPEMVTLFPTVPEDGTTDVMNISYSEYG